MNQVYKYDPRGEDMNTQRNPSTANNISPTGNYSKLSIIIWSCWLKSLKMVPTALACNHKRLLWPKERAKKTITLQLVTPMFFVCNPRIEEVGTEGSGREGEREKDSNIR